ncbi:unnamed protein product, partial [Symbiodinium sp. CCMP2456]
YEIYDASTTTTQPLLLWEKDGARKEDEEVKLEQGPWTEAGHGREAYAFPKYDAERVDLSKPAAQVIAVQTAQRGEPTRALANDLQALINQTRRMTNKKASLEENRKQKLAQWEKYQHDMQRSYKSEKERHYNAMSKIEEDLAQAKAMCEKAQEQMSQAADAAGLNLDANMLMADDMEWRRLVGESTPVDVSPEEILLVREMRRQGALGMPPGLPSPVTTSPPGDTGLPMDLFQEKGPDANNGPIAPRGEGYTAISPSAHRAEPYPAHSPSGLRPRVEVSMAVEAKATRQPPETRHPGQRDPSQNRLPTSIEPPRPGIKEATMRPPARADVSGRFQSKLDEVRQREGNALRAFGSVEVPLAEAKETEPTASAGVLPTKFVEDDPDHVESPGFLGLE